ncbi:MAG: polar amino acid transport system substrate-binding protein, partial [Bacteroidia bacterium]
ENHDIQNLLNLLDGSVDFVVGDRRTLMHQINEYLFKRKGELAVARVSLPQVQRHVALSRDLPDYTEILEQFNKSLAASRKDGSIDAIVKKWDDALGTL